jgi:tRNA_anti-like
MFKGSRKILTVITILLLAAISYGLYVWNKPQRDVQDEKAVTIAATAIFDSFIVNETKANELYLNKAIQVTGEVSEVKKNQDGNAVVYLKSTDPVFGVNCTFKEDPGPLEKGTTITFKGICTGYLSDVIINQGIIVKE